MLRKSLDGRKTSRHNGPHEHTAYPIDLPHERTATRGATVRPTTSRLRSAVVWLLVLGVPTPNERKIDGSID